MVARHDLTTDPRLRAELLTVRRGTAFFARKLGELSDAELDEPSLLPGWSRRHLIAHVGYNARALTRLVQWANTGVETPMYDSPEARDAEIDFGATLPARALRHLIEHAAISLDVEWRDSPDDAWAAVVRTAQGREVPARETVWMRTREVWLHAIDLDNGAGFGDVPEPVLERLLADITGTWRARGPTRASSSRSTAPATPRSTAPRSATKVLPVIPATTVIPAATPFAAPPTAMLRPSSAVPCPRSCAGPRGAVTPGCGHRRVLPSPRRGGCEQIPQPLTARGSPAVMCTAGEPLVMFRPDPVRAPTRPETASDRPGNSQLSEVSRQAATSSRASCAARPT